MQACVKYKTGHMICLYALALFSVSTCQAPPTWTETCGTFCSIMFEDWIEKNIFCLFCQFGLLYLGWLMRQKRTSSWVKQLAAAFKMSWHASRLEIACKTSNSIFMSHIGEKLKSNSSCGLMFCFFWKGLLVKEQN